LPTYLRSLSSATSRTCDVLPMGARVAELLHCGLDLSSRVAQLPLRLEYGVSSDAVYLARVTGRELDRGDYRRLSASGLADPTAIDAAPDELLLQQVDDNRTKCGWSVFSRRGRARRDEHQCNRCQRIKHDLGD
jgi:helicase